MNLRVLFLMMCVVLSSCRLRTRELPPPRDGVHHKESSQISGRGYSSDEYYENGVVRREIIYSELGKRVYEHTKYYSSDRIDSSMMFFESGALSAVWLSRDHKIIVHRAFYENGTVASWGDSSGEREAFYENGQKQYTLAWSNGEVREKKEWYANGTMKELSEWNDDKLDGKYIQWDSTGREIRKELYTAGVRIRK